MNEPTHIDLFSGIGGFALAAQWAGFRTVAFCEIDKYCQKVLAKNFMADTEYLRELQSERGECLLGRWTGNGSPKLIGDIRNLNGRDVYGCDLLTGGFPCQPFSVAGKRGGASDDRHLWPEMLRVIKEARPAWVLGENVPGIIPMELDNVLSDLEGIGYATRPFVIPACAVDAKHRRDRLWIVAHAISDNDQRTERGATRPGETQSGRSLGESSGCGSVPDADQQGLEGQRQQPCGTGTQLNDACRPLPVAA